MSRQLAGFFHVWCLEASQKGMNHDNMSGRIASSDNKENTNGNADKFAAGWAGVIGRVVYLGDDSAWIGNGILFQKY